MFFYTEPAFATGTAVARLFIGLAGPAVTVVIAS